MVPRWTVTSTAMEMCVTCLMLLRISFELTFGSWRVTGVSLEAMVRSLTGSELTEVVLETTKLAEGVYE